MQKRFNQYNKYDLYVRKSNLSILNSPALKKLNRIKYITIQYDEETDTFKKGFVYKAFGSLTKIFMFDSFISYKCNNGEVSKQFINLYIPTITLDYIKYVCKDSILNDLDNLRIKDMELLINDIDGLFKLQNKFYKKDDYLAIKEKYNLSETASYKERVKALNEYIKEKGEVPGFYFWLAVLYDVYPFVNYLGKASHTLNKKNEESLFFIYPDKNDPDDWR